MHNAKENPLTPVTILKHTMKSFELVLSTLSWLGFFSMTQRLVMDMKQLVFKFREFFLNWTKQTNKQMLQELLKNSKGQLHHIIWFSVYYRLLYFLNIPLCGITLFAVPLENVDKRKIVYYKGSAASASQICAWFVTVFTWAHRFLYYFHPPAPRLKNP